MDKIFRKKTKQILIGNIPVGGDNKISIQSMTNTKTRNVEATLRQINELINEGCEIIRVAVPTKEDAFAIKEIKSNINIPLIADIHFDHRLALYAIENNADKIRINPGNIQDQGKVREIISEAKKKNIAIRLGVNSGSLEKEILEKHQHPTAEALVESAINWIDFFEKASFEKIILSVKSSNVFTNFKAYKLLAEKIDYPLHIGVTEAGFQSEGIIKSSAGIGALLISGIGDTIRVSLTGSPIQEIQVAKTLLQSLGLRKFHPEFVSCPTCGRCEINLENLVTQVYSRLKNTPVNIKIAIMGCVVNGPGEAKEADFGIAGGKNKGIIFKKGELVKTVESKELVNEFFKLLKAEGV